MRDGVVVAVVSGVVAVVSKLIDHALGDEERDLRIEKARLENEKLQRELKRQSDTSVGCSKV